jgi:HCOMODA/2-hydroxy-3-carboxy-muconic semialdehyde decarboxylase
MRSQTESLVLANQILALNAVVDAFGHVSVRSEKDPQRFLMSRSLAPELVREPDILSFGLDGEAIDDHAGPFYLERFIHSEIYKSRPDVNAIVHSHSHSVIPFSVVRASLTPVFHIAGFIPHSTPVFDIAEQFGETDLLVSTPEQGAALARVLGGETAVLMRGHGSVVVGPSLQIAVARAIWLDVNAKILLSARLLGDVKTLSPGEAARAGAMSEKQAGRAWALWARDAERAIAKEDGLRV